MSNFTNSGRQYALTLEQVFDFEDMKASPIKVKPKLPQGAVVLRGGVLVETPFGTGTAVAVGNATTAGKYATAADLSAAAFVPFTTGLNTLLSSGETIVFTPDTETLAATAGKARLILEYIQVNRAHEAQP